MEFTAHPATSNYFLFSVWDLTEVQPILLGGFIGHISLAEARLPDLVGGESLRWGSFCHSMMYSWRSRLAISLLENC